MTQMKAVVLHEAGGPEALKIEMRPLPDVPKGWIRIKVKAFGINRSELFTRQGHSPTVKLPRILGIEAVGLVDDAPQTGFAKGDKVVTVMGGMGRVFDGGYAEYTCVPANQVRKLSTDLPWETLGALPEMLQTAWGSLFAALRLARGDRLLVRGGTTSVGMAAIALARRAGAQVAATTRRKDRAEMLRDLGADQVIIDDGAISKETDRFDKVLELVGTTTLGDSLGCLERGGIACMTGMVGNEWSLPDFAPMDVIPHCAYLTIYSGGVDEFMKMPLDELLTDVANGEIPLRIGRVFTLDQIAAAHEAMENNSAGGKIVVTVD